MSSFTGILGTGNSQLGDIILGSAPSTDSNATLTVDAVLLRAQSASFTIDAVIASAVVTTSFTSDAVLSKSQSASFAANAVLKKAQSASLTADAVIVASSRFYLNATLAAPISPSFASGWESTTSAVRRMMGRPSLAVSTKTNLGLAETSTSGTFDRLIYQFVSEPLGLASTISGPLTGLIRATESSTSADFRSQMVVKVVSGDGTTLRGTVIDFNASALSNEWPTTSASRAFPVLTTAVTPVDAQAGDRIVVEVGYRAHNTSSTSFTGTLRAGHTVGGTDFTATAETADNNPWIDISATTRLLPTETSITADAVINVHRSASFTIDAILFQPSFTIDAVILGLFVQQHDRWTTHTGIDHGVDHILARPIGTFMRGTNLMDVLIDMDARLTAKEQQKALRLTALTLDAVIV
jgi:hypothetical protein